MHRLLWTDTRGDAVLIYEAGVQGRGAYLMPAPAIDQKRYLRL